MTVFHVLHPDEIDFPFTGNVKFDGLELPEEIKTRPHLIRPAYQRIVQDYLVELQKRLRREPRRLRARWTPTSRWNRRCRSTWSRRLQMGRL